MTGNTHGWAIIGAETYMDMDFESFETGIFTKHWN